MILYPNAKINLGLNVVGRRPDGYHNIETVFYPTAWRDVLEIIPRDDAGADTLSVSGNGVDCPPEKNLVMKAAAAFRRATGFDRGVGFWLRKNIPDGAGLGGGSADASFALEGLNAIAGSPLGRDELAAIAATIGADCPFFIYNRPMIATGIGTDLAPIDLNLGGMTLVIVKPPKSVSTAEAYRGIRLRPASEPAPDIAALIAGPADAWQGALVNDFETSVFAALPELAAVKQALLDAGALYASMSGSGSAVFGIFAPAAGDDRMSAEGLARRFRALWPGWPVHAETLPDLN